MFIPGGVISALTFPGVVTHELAHQLFCNYFKIPVHEICYFRLGNPAGYVIHERVDNPLHQILIAAGPFFLNSIFGAIISFPSALRDGLGGTSILNLVLMWFGISIAMHAIPSVDDAKSMWKAVSGKNSSFLVKITVAPVVGLIFLFSIGSVFWLDLVYGIFVCMAFPTILVAMLA